MKIIKKILSFIPTILTSLLLAFVVWFSAVNSKDPTEEITYVQPIPIEILGQNPQYTISEQSANNIIVTIKAPQSVHNALSNDMGQIQARINIAELQDGHAELIPDITVGIKPAKVVDFNPKTVRLTIEKLVTETFDVKLNQTGNLPMGLEARTPRLDPLDVHVTGPVSKVSLVQEVLATVDMSMVTTNLTKQVDLQAIDAEGNIVEGLTLSPSRVTVTIPVLQRADYQNAFLALIPLGSPAYGFQITHIEITPQFVTIYAKNPSLANSLPDMIETMPINLNGRDASFEEVVEINLPEGVQLAGDVEVVVRVTIEPIITSKSVRGIPITTMNLDENLEATLNISTVDVYLTGPTNLLATLNPQNITIALDLTDLDVGTHQVKPIIVLPDPAITYRIVLEMLEVKIQAK